MASDIERYRKFGNNYFILKTPSGTELTGVLLELPSFSFSTKWEESPAAAMGEEIYKLINKPEIEFLASTTDGANVMRRTGNLTSKVYENAEPVSFELKFRCYPGQSFGDDDGLTAASTWISTLSSTTTVSSNTRFNVNKITNNLFAAAKGGAEQVFKIVDDVKSLLDPEKNGNETTLEYQLEEKEKQIDEQEKKEKKDGRGSVIGSSDLNKLIQEREAIKKAIRDRDNEMAEGFNIVNQKTYDNRVNKSVENFGSSLFNLTLYPFIFKKPFIVYISSWNVKPSKEYNLRRSDNFYYDFTLSCTMDRILSGKAWEYQLI